jgi:two-component system, OmpR family, phosphate regulon sensor histidine kinase PhoR
LLNVFSALEVPNPSGQNVYWVLLSVGSIMFAFVLTGVILYLVWIIQNINLNRRQSNFIDAVTHELKTPIASLKLYLQTLNRRPVDGPQRQQFYKTMMEDVDRLDRLINQLLDVARLQHQQSNPIQEEWVRVDAVIHDCGSQLIHQYELDSSVLRLQLEPCEVLAHKIDIEVLLRNLMDNAIKYSASPPQVEIELHFEQSNAVVTVEDNGPGIPRHLRRKVFSRFYRAGDELERKKPGTGLGLFLVRSIVQRLKGSVRVLDSTTRIGSKFLVSLPNARMVENLERSQSQPLTE